MQSNRWLGQVVPALQPAGRPKASLRLQVVTASAVQPTASEDREDPVRETSPVKRPDRGVRSLNPVCDVRRH